MLYSIFKYSMRATQDENIRRYYFFNVITLFLFLHLDKLKVFSYNKANNF